jgi:hypothetical protein
MTDIEHLRHDGRILEAALRETDLPTLVLPTVRKAPPPRRTRDGVNVALCVLVIVIAVGLAGWWITSADDPAPGKGTPATCLFTCSSTTGS